MHHKQMSMLAPVGANALQGNINCSVPAGAFALQTNVNFSALAGANASQVNVNCSAPSGANALQGNVNCSALVNALQANVSTTELHFNCSCIAASELVVAKLI